MLPQTDLRRIRSRARRHPEFWASALARHADLHTDTDRPLHDLLGVSAEALDRLSLWKLPRPDREAEDLAEAAAASGVAVEQLRLILREEVP